MCFGCSCYKLGCSSVLNGHGFPCRDFMFSIVVFSMFFDDVKRGKSKYPGT